MSDNTMVQAYLFFDGKCDEAIEFYKKALGAELTMLMRYKESPEPPPPDCGPMDPNKVMSRQFAHWRNARSWPPTGAPPASRIFKALRCRSR